MKQYLVSYSEHAVYQKIFNANTHKEALDLARKELEDNCWDTKTWETGSGEGGQLDVELA